MGPLTTTVEDAGLALAALARFEPPQYSGLGDIRIGVPENYYFENSDPAVVDAVERTLKASHARLVPVRVPDIDELNVVARVILLSEATAVYERFLARRDDFGTDVLALLDQGRFVPATDYVNAQRVRQVFVREFNRMFKSIDCLATPTTPTPAPSIGEMKTEIRGKEHDVRLAATRFMRGINVVGLPAISIPCGSVGGLPVGLQLVARLHEDALLLRAAAALEAVARR